jgi:hypothetical protein
MGRSWPIFATEACKHGRLDTVSSFPFAPQAFEFFNCLWEHEQVASGTPPFRSGVADFSRFLFSFGTCLGICRDDTGVERARLSRSSFPRRRESSTLGSLGSRLRGNDKWCWFPACAGMTSAAGMTDGVLCSDNQLSATEELGRIQQNPQQIFQARPEISAAFKMLQ